MGSWFAAYQNGECNAAQSRYWQPKPPEELYDTQADPFEIHNLADDPQHADRLRRMQAALRAEMLASRDAGFIPEGLFEQLAGEGTIYDYAQSDAYPLERIIDVADLASARDPRHLPDLIATMDHPHPVIRYWGAVGCLVLGDRAAPAREKLQALLNDDVPDVRIAAAEALGHLGDTADAIAALTPLLNSDNVYQSLAALNALDFLTQAGHVPLPRTQALVRDLQLSEPADRIPAYLLSLSAPASRAE
jgi:hypothetical protein